MHNSHPTYIALLLVFLMPASVLAAGFAKQSLFLSQSSVTEGQTVFIYAVVTDDSDTPFTGILGFYDETGAIGSTTVTLLSGKASTVSVPWTPKAGVHQVIAKLVAKDGTVTETENATFTVDAVPPPQPVKETPTTEPAVAKKNTVTATTTTTTIDSSAPIEKSLSNIAPSIAPKATPIFGAIDSFRGTSVKLLDNGSDWSKNSITKAALAPGGFMNTVWLIFTTLVLYVCASLTYVVSNIALFYPAIVIIFLFVLWRIYRTIRD